MGRRQCALDPSRTGRDAITLESRLRQMVVGQDEAIAQIVNIYQMYQTGLSAPQRPVGNFLFLGPTGSGKTRIVEAAAEALIGTPRAVIKVDCAEFQHSHEIAKLIGSPPGYLGHRETHPLLSQEVLNQYHTERLKLSFVLFDEIEKASDSLWNLLLGILDKATLTLGDNRKVDFSRTLIFMTSNLGAGEMSSIISPRLGFGSTLRDERSPMDQKTGEKIARSGVEAARKKFTPEFMNRLDKVVVFNPLGEKELRKILDIELGMVQQRVFCSTAERSFVFTVADVAKDYLLEQGTDLKYGARHLKRAIERLVVHPMSNLIATEQVRGGDLIRVDMDAGGDCLTFMREAEGLAIQTMAEMVDPPSRGWMKGTGAVAPDYAKPTVARSTRRG
ncbi:MAG: ATP-dependent Clp protease ATP-binding subunit [Acidobacteria bacterium]|nr:ATP-dependent Clp protease ATP-binding subunit [Acidobacteriota bacterium]